MGWKQFLKPDWRKIVILIIIAILGTIAFIMSFYSFVGIPLGESDIINNVILNLFFVLIALIIHIYPDNFIFLFLVNSFYWYLLSCIIVWIYNKFRKKNKK